MYRYKAEQQRFLAKADDAAGQAVLRAVQQAEDFNKRREAARPRWERACSMCGKQMVTFTDPQNWHHEPPPTCGDECKDARKRRVQKDIDALNRELKLL